MKALTRDELAAFLAIVHPTWRVLFGLLAATGLRISEALALDVRYLALDGSRPHVKVRRAIGLDGFDRPKSDHGIRDPPLPAALVHELRQHHRRPARPVRRDPARVGEARVPVSDRRGDGPRQPPAPRAQAGRGGGGGRVGVLHAFRHTFASLHIERGTNIVRLSRLLGHHKPSFTI